MFFLNFFLLANIACVLGTNPKIFCLVFSPLYCVDKKNNSHESNVVKYNFKTNLIIIILDLIVALIVLTGMRVTVSWELGWETL